MENGDIVLIPFPFADKRTVKVRPAVVITTTADKYRDLVVSAISSVDPHTVGRNEMAVSPTAMNGLRVRSVIKVDRIVTIQRDMVLAHIGKLSTSELKAFKTIFRALVSE
jgi:mRNA interferase MazF